MKTLKLKTMGVPTNENEVGNHRVRCKFLSAEGRMVTADFGNMTLNPKANKKNRKLNALHCDMYINSKGMGERRYHVNKVDTSDMSYTMSDILKAVNSVSKTCYDRVEVVD